MDFRVLGPVQVIADDGNEIQLGSRNQRAVLAALLSGRRQPVSRDRIIDAVWGEAMPADPHNTLQHYVSRLRRVLINGSHPSDPIIRRVGHGYLISPAEDSVDADRFLAAVRNAREARRNGSPEEAESLLATAMAEWRGIPYEGLDLESLRLEVRELEETRLDGLEDLFDVRLALSRHRESVPELERLSSENPLRERFWGQLMTALYRSGRQAEALRAYQRARLHLGESLGIDPSADLRSLEERILVNDPDLDAGTPVNQLPQRRSSGHLPIPPTRFIGRTETLAILNAVVADSDVVTILGASGTGKSRMAIEFATRERHAFRGGVHFVSLDGLDDGTSVASVVAGAVGLRENIQRLLPEALAEHIANLGALVVLDGCDQVAEACGDLVDRVRRRSNSSTLIATSTILLGVEGEVRLELPPLGFSPDHSDSDGVNLFVDRAQLVIPGWRALPGELEIVRRIAAAVDGSPLAIELAAARIDVRALDEIADGLENGDALVRGAGRPHGGRSLFEAAEWSIGQLTADELEAFERLAVFVQGFDREAATTIALNGWPHIEVGAFLSRLVARSLVRVDRSVDGIRYVIPTGLRELTRERLLGRPDSDAVQAAHATWFARWAANAEHELIGPDLERWVRVLSREQPNLRAALAYSHASGDVHTMHRLVASLCRYWDWTGHLFDAMHWVGRSLDSSGDHESPARTWISIWAVYLATEAGDIEQALVHAEEAIARARSSDDPDQLTAALGNLGIAYRTQGDSERAVAAGRQAVAAADGGTPWFRSWAACALAFTLQASGSLETSQFAQRSLDGFRQLGDRASEAWSLDLLARVAVSEGDADGAELYARHALLNAHLLGALRTVSSSLQTLALIAQARRDMGRAVSLLSASKSMIRYESGTHRHQTGAITSEAARVLTPGEYATAWERGRQMTLESILSE